MCDGRVPAANVVCACDMPSDDRRCRRAAAKMDALEVLDPESLVIEELAFSANLFSAVSAARAAVSAVDGM